MVASSSEQDVMPDAVRMESELIENQPETDNDSPNELPDTDCTSGESGDETVPPVNSVFVSDDVNEIVVAFEKHMASVDGGAKARPEIYSLALRQIIEACGGSVALLTKANVGTLYVEPLLAQGRAKKLSIKTVRNKLRSLEYFCKYFVNLLGAESDMIVVNICSELLKLEKCLPAWRQALRSKCSLEDVRRRVQDGAERIDPADVQNYYSSDYARYAVRLLTTALDGTWAPAMYDFIRARNHMLVILSVSNAHRSGVLINFTIDDYDKCVKADSVNVVFSVCEHKTVATHGAATIAASAEEAHLLAGYMRLRKHSVFSNAAPYVFINSSGTQMTQSNVAAALTAAFSKGGFGDRVTCTKLRKAAVTQVHSQLPQMKLDVASHMCHRVATAEKHYKFTDKQTNSVKCSALLRQVFSKPAATASSSLDCVPSTSSKDDKLQQLSSNVDRCDDDRDDNLDDQPYRKKIIWNHDDRDLVKKKFADFIRREKTPIAEITNVIENDAELRLHLQSSLNLIGRPLVLAIRNKIRSFFRWKKANT